MKTQVCAVTVAYNNPKELKNLLSSLEQQNHSLSGLIVVDNSDDPYLAKNKEVFNRYSKKYNQASYHKTEKNIGSAGGFRLAMQAAHDNCFDWIWLLDQDGAVSPGCLAELLKHAQDGDILVPKMIDINQPDNSQPWAACRNFLGRKYPIASASNCQIHAFGTHAVLISKKVLDTIGYYDDALFFVGYEDNDYGYRAVQAGFVIFFVAGAEARHPCKKPTGKKLKILPAQFLKILPADMDYLTHLPLVEKPCSRTEIRSIAPYSLAYLQSKYLQPWQFAVSLVFAECYALYRKVAGERRIALMKTLRLYCVCLACSVKHDWPYDTIELLCQELLRAHPGRG